MNTERKTCVTSSVLLVDDEPGMRTALRANFLRYGWQVEVADGVQSAERMINRKDFDLVITDIRMRDGNGFDVMERVRKSNPNTAVVLLTAFGSVPEAVSSMQNGACDYIMKPVSFDQLQEAVTRVLERMTTAALAAPAAQADPVPAIKPESSGIIGNSPQLLKALQRARAAATTNADVLVEAESGSGKEKLARYIHDSSHRRDKPFVAINCAAVPEALLESELFGHMKGAFTGAVTDKVGKFELANGGTILLDEIGEMPLNLQPKLLRVLQEREIERLGANRSTQLDIRVIATTNASLASMVRQGTFRSDLYYRLNVIPLSLPPLRERLDDVADLARHFAQTFAASAGRPTPKLDPGFIEELQAHDWPGNIRELANFMRRVVSLHDGDVLDADSFRHEFRPLPTHELSFTAPSAPRAAKPVMSTRISDVERAHLESTLVMTGGNRTHAAAMLGISLRTVRNKIKEYGLPPGATHEFNQLTLSTRKLHQPRWSAGADHRCQHGQRRHARLPRSRYRLRP